MTARVVRITTLRTSSPERMMPRRQRPGSTEETSTESLLTSRRIGRGEKLTLIDVKYWVIKEVTT